MIAVFFLMGGSPPAAAGGIGTESYQYLADGTCDIANAGDGVLTITGDTMAKQSVDEISVTIYLQYWNGLEWADIGGPWRYTDWNTSYVGGGLDINAQLGYWYRSRCVHVVEHNGTYESGDSISGSVRL